ncbi:spore coat polysaccharide biosynthesis protein SpsF [Chryseobacterium defluvii]|uniref:Spore coat polysaccharide biosynthesis protein SpsF n=1 Tax=Chryseobacterium defluvii TaxID=160396 RepID=A0A840KBM0_9FLAO|nr:hypothetical protein [Chryseobacterium defluvii]MBB4806596.1 spore coat polysaccharide biosynthesis protein SpsF [Chryseobacterium defluvii]
MAKVVACIIARTVSTRLPLKVLRDLLPNKSMIEFLIERIKSVKAVDEIYLCTSKENVDDIFEDIAARNGVKIYRGSADEVTERLISTGELENADYIIRITGDNPFTSVEYLPKQIEFVIHNDLDYVRVVDVPIGATPEIIKLDALKKCHAEMDPKVSEYLMLYLFEPANFKCGIIKPFSQDFSHFTVTVDTKEDLLRSRKIINLLNEKPESILLSDIISVYINEKIENSTISGGGMIKLPYDKMIPFEEFSFDMERRKSNSKLLKLYE